MSQSFTVGTRPTVVARFRSVDIDGVETLADPTTVRVVTRNPDGVQTTYTSPNVNLVNVGTGIWQFTFPAELTDPGTWRVYFDGDGAVDVADEIEFRIRGARTLA